MPSAAAPSQPIRLLPRLTGAQVQKVTYTRKTHADEMKTTCWGRGRKVDVICLLFTWCGKYTNTVVTQMHRSDTTHTGCTDTGSCGGDGCDTVCGQWKGLGGVPRLTLRRAAPALTRLPQPRLPAPAGRPAVRRRTHPPTPGVPGPAPCAVGLGAGGTWTCTPLKANSFLQASQLPTPLQGGQGVQVPTNVCTGPHSKMGLLSTLPPPGPWEGPWGAQPQVSFW